MRPGIDETMLTIASALSKRATCVKKSVGCVLVDIHGRVLATGYNGVPSGWIHCVDSPCINGCLATHAESNSLLSCHAPKENIYACYVTDSPCLACCKQLVQTGCKRIMYLRESEEIVIAREFWQRDRRAWIDCTVGKTVRERA